MSDRETMDCDLLIVGGGPAGLSCAIRLMQNIERHNEASENKIDEPMIVLIEKGAAVGAHGFSGGIMVPEVLEELIPDRSQWGFDFQVPVGSDHMRYFTRDLSLPAPHAPGHSNEGNLIVSLNQVTEWMAEQAEELGVNIFPGFGGVEVLYDDSGAVCGVRTGDRGIDKNGERKANFEAGIDLKAKVTVFAEGPRGTLTKTLVRDKKLDEGRAPMVYSTGVKELWEVPAGRLTPGAVSHSMGWPLKSDEFGGGFIYQLTETLVTIGFITALDYRDPNVDPHQKLQLYKTHPEVKRLLEGGTCKAYGAKTIPEGGWDCIPKVYGAGFLIAGDSAGFLDLPSLKGIHHAMRSGIYAADTCLKVLTGSAPTEATLSSYWTAVESGELGTTLKKARHFRQHFDGNFFKGMIGAGVDLVTGGHVNILSHRLEADGKTMKTKAEYHSDRDGTLPPSRGFDGTLTFDKVSDVYLSGALHEEDQPAHLKVADLELCATRCAEEFGNPCVRFCPAAVYEMEAASPDSRPELKLNFSNCVHCKTCDIKDPYENITWTLPEGGGGPVYKQL